MEVVAIILLIIGALAIGTTTDEDNAPPGTGDSDELVIVTPAESKDEAFINRPRCHRAAGPIQHRDLTVPYALNGKSTFADAEKNAGVTHED